MDFISSSNPLLPFHSLSEINNHSFEIKKFVANNAYLSHATNFAVITGPNSSGKSTLLKMSALVTILAHAGCYVPAQHATVPLRDNGESTANCVPCYFVHMSACIGTCSAVYLYMLHHCLPVSCLVFTRIGTGDDFESNTSTFLMEMKEAAFILDRVSGLQ